MEGGRILYICSEAAVGMIPFAVNIIQTAMRSRQLEVFALMTDNDAHSYRPHFGENAHDENLFFIKTPRGKTGRIFNKFYAKNILRMAKSICRKNNIKTIHLLTGDYTCHAIVGRLKRLGKVYYTVHDVVPHDTAFASLKDYAVDRYIRYGQRRIMRRADCLATCSRNQYDALKRLFPEKKICYHPFPSLITRSIDEGRELCPELAGTERYILFFGNIALYKGIEYLCEAFGKLAGTGRFDEYKLVVAGSGRIYFKHSGGERVVFINRHIGDGEVRRLFEGAACVVYPYISATQSGVLTFAYKFGTPLIASDIPFFRENADGATTTFFKNCDAGDLALKLESLLSSTDADKVKMRAAQRSFYEKNYSEAVMTQTIEDIYNCQLSTVNCQLKIFVTGTRGIPDIQGGVETHCEELFPRLAAKGWNIVVARRKSYVRDALNSYKGVALDNIPNLRMKSFEAIVHTFRAVWAARWRHHAYVVHIHAIGPALLAPLARTLGMKVVFTHHGPDYDRAKWGPAARFMLRLGERAGCWCADETIAISTVIKDIVEQKYGCDARLIHNGAPQPVLTGDDSFLDEIGVEPRRFVFAMGRFVPEKNFHVLIAAFAALQRPDYKLVIAGDADVEDGYSRNLKRQAQRDGVVLTGFIKGDRLQSLLRHAALFVIPSTHEGLPIALLEAMSYNLPVVASDIPANLEVDLPADCYFPLGRCDDDAIASLVPAMQRKLASPAPVAYDMAAYNWDYIAEQTAEVYRDLV